MMREFLMLAKVFDPAKHNIAGWYASEKLDGQRAFWDGGVSRGKPTEQVPWANLDRKIRPVATGLWSRYGNVIVAPDWWLDKLPERVFLDGELYCGNLQTLRTIVSTDIPSEHRWKEVSYLVFDSPGLGVFQSGKINNPNFTREISFNDCVDYLGKLELPDARQLRDIAPELIKGYRGKYLKGLEQVILPSTESVARDKLYEMLNGVVTAGGEGVMLRDPRSFWSPKRIHTLLKVKPMLEGDAVIRGIIYGKGKHQGALGALRVEWRGKTFDIGTGFSDSERELSFPEKRIAWEHPGELYHEGVEKYPLDSTITFNYVSLTNDGVPREARFKNVKGAE